MEISHPYEEPTLTVILVLTGFLLLLNGVNKVLDQMLYCGLVGQVFVGVLFGTPGAKLLNDAVESTISNLGYLGLILLVYEGGLSTLLSDLIYSFTLSFLVAITGILMPIALSFLLIPLGASPLQCFSAGASLSATSLGTAFATLSSSGLLNTHMGTVLTSAAMFDDVVGLVMLQVVTKLSTGQGTASEYGRTIGRALGASVGLVLVVILICRLVLRPLYKPITSWLQSPKRSQFVKSAFMGAYFSLVVHTALLLILVVAGNYAGTSMLLAAFVAGIVVRWWGDALVPSKDEASNIKHIEPQALAVLHGPTEMGLQVYDRFYRPSAEHILKPFFFASIGFSIPITQMFHATTVWKGVVYALLMFLGKVATGLWLFPGSLDPSTRSFASFSFKWCWERKTKRRLEPGLKVEGASPDRTEVKPQDTKVVHNPLPGSSDASCAVHRLSSRENVPFPEDIAEPSTPAEMPPSALNTLCPRESDESASPFRPSPHPQPQPAPRPQPQHLHNRGDHPTPISHTPPSTAPGHRALRAYTPVLLGLAMTARGEIGFLIASVAESHGIFFPSTSSGGSPSTIPGETDDELYLVVVWAIVLCTIVGPVAVGGLVRRIKRLEAYGQGV